MSNVYYRVDGSTIYYTNESKTGYELRSTDSWVSANRAVTIELYNDKFILPAISSNLFFSAANTSFDNIDKWDTSGVTNMNYMFQSCKTLSSLDLSSFNTSNVTTMTSMFGSCESLQSLDLSSFDTYKVNSMYGMFRGCGSLTSLNVSSFNTSKVTTMNSMFSNCISLQSLDLSNFDTYNVTDMADMFAGCTSLQSVDLAGFDTSKVMYTPRMFQGCGNLVTIYAFTDFVVDLVKNSNSMFDNCTNLVGGAGTVFDSTKIDKTYAKIDGGTADPGYFTFKANPHGWFECTPYIKENDVWVPVEVYA